MKNNPYMVPEGFFDKARAEALQGAAKIRLRRRVALAAGAAALALVLCLPLSRTTTDYVDNDFAEFYEYDIFLKTFSI